MIQRKIQDYLDNLPSQLCPNHLITCQSNTFQMISQILVLIFPIVSSPQCFQLPQTPQPNVTVVIFVSLYNLLLHVIHLHSVKTFNVSSNHVKCITFSSSQSLIRISARRMSNNISGRMIDRLPRQRKVSLIQVMLRIYSSHALSRLPLRRSYGIGITYNAYVL